MKGNFHVRFLGGGAPAMALPYRSLIDKTDPAIDGIEIEPVEKSMLPV